MTSCRSVYSEAPVGGLVIPHAVGLLEFDTFSLLSLKASGFISSFFMLTLRFYPIKSSCSLVFIAESQALEMERACQHEIVSTLYRKCPGLVQL